jgi:hypothetical protein
MFINLCENNNNNNNNNNNLFSLIIYLIYPIFCDEPHYFYLRQHHGTLYSMITSKILWNFIIKLDSCSEQYVRLMKI